MVGEKRRKVMTKEMPDGIGKQLLYYAALCVVGGGAILIWLGRELCRAYHRAKGGKP
jgi:hypothetical protein